MTQTEALLLTLALEVPFVLAVGWRWVEDRRQLVAIACAASLLTHPFAWHAWAWLGPETPIVARSVVVEGAVAVAESALYARALGLPVRRALALGFGANAFSFGLGLLLAATLR